jgi:large subunit ribosomal protein L23
MKMSGIINHPLSTEKSIRLMESENKLIFVVDKKATKLEIKKELEELYDVRVTDVKTYITKKGQKRAYIRFADDSPAIDLATKLGLM